MRLISFRTSWIVLCMSLLCTSLLSTSAAQTPKPPAPKPVAQSKAGADPEKAWKEVLDLAQPINPPEAWRKTQPSQEQIDQFKASESQRLVKAADKAKEFQTRFPADSHLAEAQAKEGEMLQMAVQLGNTNVIPRLETFEQARLRDPNTSQDDRFQIRVGQVNRAAMAKMDEGRPAVFLEVEKGARALIKEFPKRSEPYEMLMAVASEAEPDKARQLAKELTQSGATEEVKDAAAALLKKMDQVGKPLAVKFAAVDGRQVDLAKLRGKVVLLDFWATWCAPCVREIPNVRSTYEKLHPKGFEIVGISFDSDKKRLVSFVTDQKMPWPQYFDGKQWENEYGKQFGIQSIPAMWLLDKKGNVRDLNGREDLAAKVEKLLAEKP